MKVFMRQNSIVISSSNGQVLCPREASMLVLYLKDLNIVSPDKWATCQLVAFLEQVSASHKDLFLYAIDSSNECLYRSFTTRDVMTIKGIG